MSLWLDAERSFAGTISDVRLAGTAIVCIVAAFGAAFLVARAVKHPTPARAANTPRTTRVADAVTTRTDTHATAELVSQFTPVQASLKRRPKPHRRHHKPKPAVVVAAVSAAPAPTPATTTPTTVTPTPVYTTPAPVQSAPAPTHTSSTAHKKKTSGGSGTTTIGG
jgi:hypothetical protein